MGRELVGLKIGASQLAAARLSVNGAPRLVQVASHPLRPGIVAGGEVRDPAALAAELKAFFKAHRLPQRAVRVGVANNRVGVRTIELAGIEDPRQLANAVRFRAQEALPIPLNEAVLDFQVLSESHRTTPSQEEETVRRVLFVVAYRDLVDGYAAAAKQAGIRLVGIDLEAFALVRALTRFAELDPDGEGSALVAVSIGSERSTLAVSNGTTCEFTRVIDWGGADLTQAVARELGIEPDAAERIKRALSLDQPAATEDLTAEQSGRAHEAILLGVRAFARELVSSLQFYQSQPGSLGLREILLAGGTAQLSGLASALEQILSIPVRVGDPTVNLTLGRRVKGEEPGPAHAVPIGLGMGI